jgi:hypothetical protein
VALFKVTHPGIIATSISITPSIIPANQVQIETYSLPAMTPEWMPHVNYPKVPLGLILLKAWCATPNTFTIAWWNLTNAPMDPSQGAGSCILQFTTH